jgi:hypothetical protein
VCPNLMSGRSSYLDNKIACGFLFMWLLFSLICPVLPISKFLNTLVKNFLPGLGPLMPLSAWRVQRARVCVCVCVCVCTCVCMCVYLEPSWWPGSTRRAPCMLGGGQRCRVHAVRPPGQGPSLGSPQCLLHPLSIGWTLGKNLTLPAPVCHPKSTSESCLGEKY